MLYVGIYNPPTKWWRRPKSIRIIVWPIWLAQWLCNHEAIDPVFDQPKHCMDCGKFFWEDSSQ